MVDSPVGVEGAEALGGGSFEVFWVGFLNIILLNFKW